MAATGTVFLFDVDNTLLDNDAVQADLGAHLESEFGRASCERYWAIFEELRAQLGYADYLGALQRYRLENLDDPQLLRLSLYLVDYPFAARLYPGALTALARCARLGRRLSVMVCLKKAMRSGWISKAALWPQWRRSQCFDCWAQMIWAFPMTIE